MGKQTGLISSLLLIQIAIFANWTPLVFAQTDTYLTIDFLHANYNIGEQMIVTGKLIDAEDRSLRSVEIQILENNDLILFNDNTLLGTGITDARGEYRISVPVSDWDGDGNGEISAYFAGNEKYTSSSSDIKYININPSRIPLGQENQYEEIKAKEKQQQDGGGCLIATAAYGTELNPYIQNLREIINQMYETNLGDSMKSFNGFYYTFSPTVADWERQNSIFRQVIKIFITPSMESFALVNHNDIKTEEGLMMYVIGIIFLNIGMYFVAPAIIIHRIKKYF